MDGDAKVRITKVERGVARPGHNEPFHRVTFEIVAGSETSFHVPIWVHGAYPDSEVQHVASIFLATCLHEAAQAVNGDTQIKESEEILDETGSERSPAPTGSSGGR